jgi:LysM repeat protein
MRQLFTLRHGVSTLLMVALACLGLGLPGHLAAAYQSGNLLQNPGFEGEYVAINGDPAVRVAPNWQPWSLPPGSSSAINARPEYKPAPASRVRSGSEAQEYNTFFATHTGGVYQRVPVSPNTELQFSIFIYVWSSGSFANPDVSEDPNNVILNVGIDPLGGTDGTSSSIVWSADAEYYDEYRQLSVTATSQNTAVTVFVRSAPQGFVGTSNIYLDDASLVVLGQAPPTETPLPPSPTPTFEFNVPTQEGTVTPLPTPVITPTPSLPGDFNSTELYTVVAGDTVWEIARRFNSSTDAIIQVNGLNSVGLINIGQTLVIPVRITYTPPPTFTPAPPLPGTGTGGPTTSGVGTYTVMAGDTLFGISLRFNTTVATLAQINNIVNPNLIFPGQALRVTGVAPLPTPTPVPPPSSVPPPVPPPPGLPYTHVVQPGENLFRIALQYNMTWDVVARANGLCYPYLLFPGQRLVIPR